MANISKIPREVSNSEIEKSEIAIFPSLVTVEAKGSRHSSDINNPKGIPTILPENTRILSHHLKADKELVKNLVGKDKKMSFADMGKMYNTIPELTTLMNPKEDDLAKKTAQLMLTKKAAQLDGIFEGQEAQKEQTSMNTLDDILGKVSVMKNGGKIKTPTYQKGGYSNPYGLFNSTLPTAPTVPTFNRDLGVGTYQPDYTLNPIDPNTPYWQQQVQQHFRANPNSYKRVGNQLVYQPFAGNEVAGLVEAGTRRSNDPNVVNYQADYLGYNLKDSTYDESPEAKLKRYGYMQHRFDNRASGWGHENEFIGINPDGSQEKFKLNDQTNLNKYTDFRFPTRTNFQGQVVPTPIDGDIREKKGRVTDNYVPTFNVEYNESVTPTGTIPGLPQGNNPLQPLPTRPLNPIPVPSNQPPIPKELLPIPNQPQKKKPFDDLYGMTQLRDIVDLATLDVRPPAYNYKPQNIAYTRYLPQNTLEGERQYNVMKQQVENSNMPESAKAAMLGDLQAKLQDNSSRVMLQNVQGDNQNDNQNVGLYNNVTNQNRAERIQYDDRYAELQDRTLSNLSVEQNRLKDQLINNYGKHKNEQLKLSLLNSMGEGYYYDNGEIKPVPGYKFRNTEDPMQQYSRQQVQTKMLHILNNPNLYTDAQFKAASDFLKPK